MTGKEAVKLSGRSETWLRRHQCAWCGQTLWLALTGGCGAIGEQCAPEKKNFGPDAMHRRLVTEPTGNAFR